ncbi:MAG: V-type ATP synthase subunit F [Dehalococcoidia bacterium]|nr:V-type ATP synthase subunit F [Dehalococcoidia bacterium]
MSESSVKNLEVAVIGDNELVSALRLAGIRRTRVIPDDRTAADEIRTSLQEYMSDPDVGVVVLLEEFADLAGSLVLQYRQSKSVLPVIVEVPSKRGTKHPDVVGYYKQFSRGFLGFDIEI